MTDLWSYLQNTSKPIVLYGTGDGADKIYARLCEKNIKISGVFASDGFKKGKEFAGFTVTSYDELKEKLGDMIILVCFGSHLDSVIEYIKALAENNELYLPDVPVCQGEIFDLDFARAHKEELSKIYSLLADEQSRMVFKNTIYFKLTGKLDYLLMCESEKAEAYEILKLNGEHFLDLGAFNGDTVAEFAFYDKDYGSITAVEPDSRNFRKLSENTSRMERVSLINAAVDNKEGSIFISKNKGRGNKQGGKNVEIDSVCIDKIAQKNPFTFINMDVEGSEEKAIDGGINTIIQKPKMLIAAYHRSEDLYAIPLKILEIRNDYKLYMRKHKAIPAWDINYLFI